MPLSDVVDELKSDGGMIDQQSYAAVIQWLKDHGYTGRPERWHTSKRKVSEVLPEKIQWFIDSATDLDEDDLRRMLRKRGAL